MTFLICDDPRLVPITYQRTDKQVMVPQVMVPVQVISDEEYCVCVGDKHYRYYTDETLPSEIKVCLAMIYAFPKRTGSYILGWSDYRGNFMSPSAYTNQQAPQLDGIGWHVIDDIYTVILDREVLMRIRDE